MLFKIFRTFTLATYLELKKAFSIFLAFVFLMSTLGTSVAIGYCPMKKDHSFSLKSHKTCCCKKSNKNCCNSTHISLEKIKDNYVVSESQINLQQYHFIVFNYPSVIIQSVNPLANSFRRPTDNQPPEPSVSRSILYRSILI